MLTPSHNGARAVGDRWSCVHVYHAGNLDRLLREVVFPATTQMQTENLISYWFYPILGRWHPSSDTPISFSI